MFICMNTGYDVLSHIYLYICINICFDICDNTSRSNWIYYRTAKSFIIQNQFCNLP